jgi:hypothetical protein
MIQVIQHPDVVRCFVDTEFYEDGTTIDMISLGAVRSDGREFYAVNQDAKLDRVSDWVREHVLPKLPPYGDPAWKTREKIAKDFSAFMAACEGEPVGRSVSEVWGYYSDYDWIVICQMYGTMRKLPKHFPKFCFDLKQFSKMLGSPMHPPDPEGEHNALVDARWNHALYAFLRRYAQANLGHLLRIDEGERQMILLALAHLSNERPGWDDALNRIASRIDNEDSKHPGRAEMYDEFKRLNTGRDCPTSLFGMRVEESDGAPKAVGVPIPVDPNGKEEGTPP